MNLKKLLIPAILPLAAVLGGCGAIVLEPAGDVAARQRDLLVLSTGLMLLIIVPVMALTVLFAWRYRQSAKARDYEPEWDHSTKLELVIWSAPLLIIICLGAMTWMGTHLLDPYRPLDRLAEGQPIPAGTKALEVNVVALDWKWLFIYPEEGIATVNELALPTNRPVRFRITSASVMNSFYIPAMAGQIYAMPGMETKLHGVMNRQGVFDGFSANYSGSGFSHMRFKVHSTDEAGFAGWVQQVRDGGGNLTRERYLQLEQPSENVPVTTFAGVEKGLFPAVLNMCVRPGKMCMGEMMAIDARGGMGRAGIYNVMPLTYDKYGRGGATSAKAESRAESFNRAYVVGLCASPESVQTAGKFAEGGAESSPLVGQGLTPPMMGGMSGGGFARLFGLQKTASTQQTQLW